MEDSRILKQINKIENYKVRTYLKSKITNTCIRNFLAILGNHNQFNTLKFEVNPIVLSIILELGEPLDFLIKKKELDKIDDIGLHPIDYASMMNNQLGFVEIQKNMNQYRVLITEDSESDKALLKNLTFDKKSIFRGVDFLFSDYDLLDEKNINNCIKKIIPNGGKKTFKLISKFIGDKFLDMTPLHYLHYLSIYIKDANHINDVLENIKYTEFEDLIPLHFIIDRMNDNRKIEFIKSLGLEGTERGILIKDTLYQYKELIKITNGEYEIDFKSINNLKDLHDSISEDFRLVMNNSSDKLFFMERKFPFLKDFVKQKFNGLDIILPKSSAMLSDWGNKLGNCIASYSNEVDGGRSLVFALYENEVVKYNIEISTCDFKIMQFVGKGNTPVENDLREHLQVMIDGYKNTIITSGDFQISLPVLDRIFLMPIIQVNTPVNDKEVYLTKIFKLEPRKRNDVKMIGQLPILDNSISLILSDKQSKNCLFTYLTDNVKGTSLFINISNKIKNNIKEDNYKNIMEIIKNSKEQNIFLNISKTMSWSNKSYPKNMNSSEVSELISSLKNNSKNIFLLINKVDKNEVLKYNNKAILNDNTSQIFYSNKDKSIDLKSRVNIIKSQYGKDFFFIDS